MGILFEQHITICSTLRSGLTEWVLWAKSVVAVLVVAGAIRNSLDGRNAFRPYAHAGRSAVCVGLEMAIAYILLERSIIKCNGPT